MGEIEVNVILVRTSSASLAHLLHHRPRDHVPGGEVLDRGCVALHETFTGSVAQDSTFSARTLGQENTKAGEARGMELVELHVF